MIKLITIGLVFFSFAATSAQASWKDDIRGEYRITDTRKDDSLKQFSLGLSAYTTTVSISLSTVDDIEFEGPALSMGYGFSDHIAINAVFFFLESGNNRILSTIQSDGYDLMLQFGTGLAMDGFKAYGGIGLYRDNWSGNANTVGEITFDGFQLGGGLGYNWDNVSLTATVNIRNTNGYDQLMNSYIIASYAGTTSSGYSNGYVMSSAVTLAVRF